MKQFSIFILAFVLCFPVLAGDHWRPVGARAAAMGMASVSIADNWSVHNNPAGMAFYNRPAAGFYYENNFMLKELGYQAASLTIPTRYGVFGGNVTYTGDASYNEANAGVAYSRTFGSRFAAGIQLDYFHTGLTKEYGSVGIATFEVGILTKLSNNLNFGAHIFNPLNAKISGFYDERIAAVMRAGFTYTFSDALLMTAEVYKNSLQPIQFLAGTEYRFFKKGYARIGLATNPFKYTFGFGLEIKNFTLDVSSSVHEVLGYSPQVSLQYAFR
jgi:hypothetical protein